MDEDEDEDEDVDWDGDEAGGGSVGGGWVGADLDKGMGVHRICPWWQGMRACPDADAYRGSGRARTGRIRSVMTPDMAGQAQGAAGPRLHSDQKNGVVQLHRALLTRCRST